MSLDTVVLAVGEEDETLTGRLVTATADVAGPADASVVLAHVYTDVEYEQARERLNVDADSEVTPDEIAERNVNVRELGEPLAATGIDVTACGRLQNGATRGERIADIADDLDADLLVVGGHDRSPVGKAVFGSTAQAVMLNAPCPVTFVRDA